jgi:hypothetical protein
LEEEGKGRTNTLVGISTLNVGKKADLVYGILLGDFAGPP